MSIKPIYPRQTYKQLFFWLYRECRVDNYCASLLRNWQVMQYSWWIIYLQITNRLGNAPKFLISILSLSFSKWSLRIVYENGTVEGTVPVGESCSGNTGDLEKCERPVIKECVDRNKYCTGPPVVISNLLSFEASNNFKKSAYWLSIEISINIFLETWHCSKESYSRKNLFRIWLGKYTRYADWILL